jgi:hypothetical protein
MPPRKEYAKHGSILLRVPKSMLYEGELKPTLTRTRKAPAKTKGHSSIQIEADKAINKAHLINSGEVVTKPKRTRKQPPKEKSKKKLPKGIDTSNIIEGKRKKKERSD